MRYFEVPYKSALLRGTIHGVSDPRVLFVHGGSEDGSQRFDMFRQHLAKSGIASVAFDFLGHGKTGGDIAGLTLMSRLEQAQTVIDSIHLQKPCIIVGASMGADTAIRLTQMYPTKTLILFVPAFYPSQAFTAPFRKGFHDAISSKDGWRDSDTWQILREFSGTLLVVGAEKDDVIPEGIYDMIDECTPHVQYKELSLVPRSPHKIFPYLSEHHDEFARVFQRVYHGIVSSSSQAEWK